jgi:hypothetical protein
VPYLPQDYLYAKSPGFSGFDFVLRFYNFLIRSDHPTRTESIRKRRQIESLPGVFRDGQSLGWRAFPAATQVLLLTDFGFCVLYGLSDERHQSFVAERDSSELD